MPRKTKEPELDLETGEALATVTVKSGERPTKDDAAVLAEIRSQELTVAAAEHEYEAAKADAKENKDFMDSQILILRELCRVDQQPRLPFDDENLDSSKESA